MRLLPAGAGQPRNCDGGVVGPNRPAVVTERVVPERGCGQGPQAETAVQVGPTEPPGYVGAFLRAEKAGAEEMADV